MSTQEKILAVYKSIIDENNRLLELANSLMAEGKYDDAKKIIKSILGT